MGRVWIPGFEGHLLLAYAGFCQHPFKNLFLRINFRHVCHVRSRGFVSLVGTFHRPANGTDVEQFDELLNKQHIHLDHNLCHLLFRESVV